MGYLDSAGLAHFWGKVRSGLGGKQDKITGGFGQVVGFSAAGAPEAQYLNLGQVQDGNPVGSVISFLGQTAPAGYLACDGAEYSVSEYPALADFFRQQFGTVNHFGGDGETTFAVPDMRNLFLRGFHGQAEEQLSGEIGETQEGTVSPMLFAIPGGEGSTPSVMSTPGVSNVVQLDHADKLNGNPTVYSYVAGSLFAPISNLGFKKPATSYTARPVNMAVLYCIKAAESVPAENVYSTEEHRIGTWIDGKPLYRRVLHGVTGSSLYDTVIANDKNIATIVNSFGTLRYTDGPNYAIIPSDYTQIFYYYETGDIAIWINTSAYFNKDVTVVIEYTKTTD